MRGTVRTHAEPPLSNTKTRMTSSLCCVPNHSSRLQAAARLLQSISSDSSLATIKKINNTSNSRTNRKLKDLFVTLVWMEIISTHVAESFLHRTCFSSNYTIHQISRIDCFCSELYGTAFVVTPVFIYCIRLYQSP